MDPVWRGGLMAKGSADATPWRSHLCVCTLNQSRVTERERESQAYHQVHTSEKHTPKSNLDAQNPCRYIAARERELPFCCTWRHQCQTCRATVGRSACLADSITFKCWHIILFWINMCRGPWELKYQSQHGNNVTLPQQKHSFCFLAQHWKMAFSTLLFSWSQNMCLQGGDWGRATISGNLDLS